MPPLHSEDSDPLRYFGIGCGFAALLLTLLGCAGLIYVGRLAEAVIWGG